MNQELRTVRPPAAARKIPHNLEAEESMLGSAMLSAEALEVAVTELDTEDFYSPVHQRVHVALRGLWEAGCMTPDPVLVGDELGPEGMEAIGGPATLALIMSSCPSTTNAPAYAASILEHATRRRLISAGAEVMEMGYNPRHGDVATACDAALNLVSQVELPIGKGAPSPTVDDLLATQATYDWIVPGLLEAMDRLILTAGEGAGKSTLIRQMAVQLAAGVHPFRFGPITPLRVLLVDLENSDNQIRRKIEPLVGNVRDRLDPDRLRIEVRTDGIDLTQRHDTRWLLERVAASRPDILLIGPIYRMSSADPSDDGAARAVIRVLDLIRTKYHTALVIEAHAGHGSGMGPRELRPIGSSVWKRWPEFGYGIRPDKDSPLASDGRRRSEAFFSAWRGDRDEREWPTRLKISSVWPWQDSGYQDPTPDRDHDHGNHQQQQATGPGF